MAGQKKTRRKRHLPKSETGMVVPPAPNQLTACVAFRVF